jgi:hypothetical protein
MHFDVVGLMAKYTKVGGHFLLTSAKKKEKKYSGNIFGSIPETRENYLFNFNSDYF